MSRVSVTPQEFHYVNFDAARIAELTSTLSDQVGLAPDVVIEIHVDETTPLSRVRIDSLDPIKLHLEGGALEDPTVPRTLSDRLAADVIGRLLLRAKDRSAADFGDPPPDSELNLQQQTAWDTACMGRLERIGYDVRQPRRLYHFRNRHGFSDVSDTVFNRLWSAESVTWADIEAACAETSSARAAV